VRRGGARVRDLARAYGSAARFGSYTQEILTEPESLRRPIARLSPREHQILERLAQGQNAPGVAHDLGLSPETVRTHVRNAMRKLEANTRVQAVAIAVESGAISSAAPR
jgi:DNA-binding CsgD family transcriptional regulator